MELSILASPGVTTLLIPFVPELISNNFFFFILRGGAAPNFRPKIRKVQSFHSETDAIYLLITRHKLHAVSTFSLCAKTELFVIKTGR